MQNFLISNSTSLLTNLVDVDDEAVEEGKGNDDEDEVNDKKNDDKEDHEGSRHLMVKITKGQKNHEVADLEKVVQTQPIVDHKDLEETTNRKDPNNIFLLCASCHLPITSVHLFFCIHRLHHDHYYCDTSCKRNESKRTCQFFTFQGSRHF